VLTVILEPNLQFGGGVPHGSMVLLNAEVTTRAMDSSVVVQAKRPDAWHKHEQLVLMDKQKAKREYIHTR
jgi:hypothetical protein